MTSVSYSSQSYPQNFILTDLLPWKTLPEMVMLSTTLGTLTSVSDGKGHTGKVIQHSHAGGSEWLFVYSKNIHKGFSYCSWPAFGFRFHLCPYIRVLCYLLNCRRGTLKMYSALRLKGLNTTTLTLVQPKAFKQHFAAMQIACQGKPLLDADR